MKLHERIESAAASLAGRLIFGGVNLPEVADKAREALARTLCPWLGDEADDFAARARVDQQTIDILVRQRDQARCDLAGVIAERDEITQRWMAADTNATPPDPWAPLFAEVCVAMPADANGDGATAHAWLVSAVESASLAEDAKERRAWAIEIAARAFNAARALDREAGK